MNLNDLRASAYKAASEPKPLSGGQKDLPKQQRITPFNPPRIKSVKEKDNNFKQTVFPNVDKLSLQKKHSIKNAAERLKIAEEELTSGGLIKVPVSSPQKNGKDSVYRRVAKFLLLIGVDEAAKILPHLPPEQTERIIPEIASIRSVNAEEASVILEEFQNLMEKASGAGGVDTARSILEKAYGAKRAKELLEKAAPLGYSKPFEYLNISSSNRIFELLSGESAAVKTLVLSRIEPKKAAAVINLMTSEEKKDIIYRLAKMQPVSPEVLKRVNQSLYEKSLVQSEKAENIDGVNSLAEILKKMSPEAESNILLSIENSDPELGQDLRGKLFTLEDIINSDDRFIQERLRIMTEIDIAYLIAGKSQEFREKILSCISSGRRILVREEEELNKPLLKKDCERVTNEFISALRRGYEHGKLIVKGRNDDIYF